MIDALARPTPLVERVVLKLQAKIQSGVYLADNPVGNAYQAAHSSQAGGSGINFQRIFKLRYWVECVAAELATLRRTLNDLLAMRCAPDDVDRCAGDFAAASKRLGLSLSFKALPSTIYPLQERAHGAR